MPGTTANISSSANQQQEVAKIADELKQELKSTDTNGEQQIDLQKPGEGDTIVIDRDGSFRQTDTAAGPRN
jgi:hypothetical protein